MVSLHRNKEGANDMAWEYLTLQIFWLRLARRPKIASLGATSILKIANVLNFTQIYRRVSPTPKSGLNGWEWKSHNFELKKISL